MFLCHKCSPSSQARSRVVYKVGVLPSWFFETALTFPNWSVPKLTFPATNRSPGTGSMFAGLSTGTLKKLPGIVT